MNSILCLLQKKMSDVQISLFAVDGCIKFHCLKNVNFFWVCRLRIDPTSK